ncbi:hypothetical protein Q765_13980 [Flavobacterium rivuli WB 3.3-2 = DSM 21788]|uniref:Uncharacterized protein n=1 Tax=Flavobacterium rivuli WB 3.3-2 = DSM 21788 TaxID=1121895 RepID=A0A0A2MCB8_9FLAO|nr:hypothetical protein [Flavobacterium rivuli]KGO85935.1 hypothetical protein Q765_13980 [Flavobacterium rivuli WB 3.3-2 = DSM 21788]
MAALEYTSLIGKARILHRWFPEEIPALLDTMDGMLTAIQQEVPQRLKGWEFNIINDALQEMLLKEAQQLIREHGAAMHNSDKLFAEQLFTGLKRVYTGYCLITYAPTRKLQNRKFALAVELLFGI